MSSGRCAIALVLYVLLIQLGSWIVCSAHASAQGFDAANTSIVDGPKKTANRFALVIGNSSYRNVPSLRNTKNDAYAMAEKLKTLGYSVLYKTDLDRRSMNDVISSFLTRVEAGSEALVYYSGHGVELNGSNYLLPIDIPALSPDQERMLRTEGSNLTDLLMDLESRSARVTLVILDACRDNPFRDATGGVATRSLGATRGLGRVDPPRGTFVIFSAGVGEQAIDNLGSQDTNPNGLFTRKLLTLIDQNGLEIRSMVQKLRSEVRTAALSSTGRSQIPSYYDQLLGEFYFQPSQPKGDEAIENSCDRLVDADADAVSVLKADLSAGLQACIAASNQFPNEIRFVRQLQAVQEQRMVQKALSSDQIDFSNAYMLLYPNGKYAINVRTHVASLSVPQVTKPGPDDPAKPPAIIPPRGANVVSQVDVARVLQTELKRVGCNTDAVDGNWGLSSSKAMKSFNEIMHASLDVTKPTIEAVEALRVQPNRVCSLTCGNGQKAVGERCVAMSCNSGMRLNNQGRCDYIRQTRLPVPSKVEVENTPTRLRRLEQKVTKKVAIPPKVASNARAFRNSGAQSGRCFMFNGARQCD